MSRLHETFKGSLQNCRFDPEQFSLKHLRSLSACVTFGFKLISHLLFDLRVHNCYVIVEIKVVSSPIFQRKKPVFRKTVIEVKMSSVVVCLQCFQLICFLIDPKCRNQTAAEKTKMDAFVIHKGPTPKVVNSDLERERFKEVGQRTKLT